MPCRTNFQIESWFVFFISFKSATNKFTLIFLSICLINIFIQTIREIFINFQSQVDQKPPKLWPVDIAITFVLTGTYQQSYM